MFKEVSPSNKPSKNVLFTPEKIEKTDTEKKTEEVFIEKGSSEEKTEISQKKRELLNEMNELNFNEYLGHIEVKERREKIKDFIKNFESLPEEIKTDSIFMKKVFDCVTGCQKNDDNRNELNPTISSLMKMKSSEKILINNPDIIREIVKVNPPLVIEIFNELAKERPDSPLNNEEFLFFVLEDYNDDYNLFEFPKVPMSTEFKKRIFAKNPIILDETMREILADSKKLKNYLLEFEPKPIVKILNLCSEEVVKTLANDKDLREYILKGFANSERIHVNSIDITNLFETGNLDENEIIKLAKIHPAFIPKKFEKDKDFIFQMIKETESPIFYLSKYECRLDLSDDLVIEAVKITPKVLLIPAFNEYVSEREELRVKLEKEYISCILYFLTQNFSISNEFKKIFLEYLNSSSDTQLDKLENEALSFFENEEKEEYENPPYIRKPTKSSYYLSAIRDVKLKGNIKKGENLFFKF